MSDDKRNLLTVLKAELQFLENGGYRRTARATWRPPFVFQDSPVCLNFDPLQPPRPCSDCTLSKLVPEESAKRKFPCRHIPLNERGETVDSFYRHGTQEELEAALAEYLKTTVKRLEQEQTNATAAADSRNSRARERHVRQMIPRTEERELS